MKPLWWHCLARVNILLIYIFTNTMAGSQPHRNTRTKATWDYTVYPKKYAHGFCFAVLCCGYTLTDFPISISFTSLALWQSNDCPSASKATLMSMDKYFMWIQYERLHNHNKAKHKKNMCIFLGIYCMVLCVDTFSYPGKQTWVTNLPHAQTFPWSIQHGLTHRVNTIVWWVIQQSQQRTLGRDEQCNAINDVPTLVQ